jgi:nucleoside-diphosphate-sugar epimerase
MKCIVTGAAGFIGSHLSERLQELGHETVGIDCFTPYYDPSLKESNARDLAARGIRIERLDLATDRLDDLVADAEWIFHLAAQPGISADTPFEVYVRNNLVATQRLLEAAAASRTLSCFVNASTSSVYGYYASDGEESLPRPTSYYGVTKLAAEMLSLAYHRDRGLPACSVRIYSACGPRERPEKLFPKLIQSILRNEEFPLAEGAETHWRSFTNVHDIVDGMANLLAARDACIGEIFNLGTEECVSTSEAIRVVESIIGRPARMRRTPRRPGDQIRTQANIAKARRILGYAPRRTLAEGLAEEVKWFQARIDAAKA